MPAIQTFKKQLRGIRSTQKLTKAMKTVATVKFSKLNSIYGGYSLYSEQCKKMLLRHGEELLIPLGKEDPFAPEAFVIFTGNKGMCGSYNSEILSFAKDMIDANPKHLVFACGKKAVSYLKAKGIDIDYEYSFSDIPSYEESTQLLMDLVDLRKQGKISKVHVIYKKYVNMMHQKTAMFELFSVSDDAVHDSSLLIPDQETIIKQTARNVFNAILYELCLETALGVWAATLMTMRTAYDTALERCEELETQINRMRQSAITADVIETSAEQY